MGAIQNEAEDEKAVVMLLEMPDAAREWLRHHFRSSLQVMLTGAELRRRDLVLKAAVHMMEDLDRIGC
jgi:hypothetical protein